MAVLVPLFVLLLLLGSAASFMKQECPGGADAWLAAAQLAHKQARLVMHILHAPLLALCCILRAVEAGQAEAAAAAAAGVPACHATPSSHMLMLMWEAWEAWDPSSPCAWGEMH